MNKFLKSLTESKNTTIAGIIAIALVILTAAQKIFDNDPSTNPDLPTVVTAVVMGIIGLLAKDGGDD